MITEKKEMRLLLVSTARVGKTTMALSLMDNIVVRHLGNKPIRNVQFTVDWRLNPYIKEERITRIILKESALSSDDEDIKNFLYSEFRISLEIGDGWDAEARLCDYLSRDDPYALRDLLSNPIANSCIWKIEVDVPPNRDFLRLLPRDVILTLSDIGNTLQYVEDYLIYSDTIPHTCNNFKDIHGIILLASNLELPKVLNRNKGTLIQLLKRVPIFFIKRSDAVYPGFLYFQAMNRDANFYDYWTATRNDNKLRKFLNINYHAFYEFLRDNEINNYRGSKFNLHEEDFGFYLMPEVDINPLQPLSSNGTHNMYKIFIRNNIIDIVNNAYLGPMFF